MNRIKHEFYHGGSFNGNTCQEVLRGRDTLADVLAPVLVVKPLTDRSESGVWVGSAARAQQEAMRWNKFASCETLYSANRPLCRHEVALLEARCNDLGMWVPVTFPTESLPPKFHMVVSEMPRYARAMATKGISPGRGNEQSIEGVHVKYNKEHRNHARCGDNARRLSRMHAVRTAKTCADHSSAREPVPRKRPKRG